MGSVGADSVFGFRQFLVPLKASFSTMILRINFLVVGLVLTTIHTSSRLGAEPPITDGVRVLADVHYKTGDGMSDYEKDRCKLDLYLPKDATMFATLVWFHGGGLKNGDKAGTTRIARSLAAAGIAVVSANYRLSPMATFPAYVEDAAVAVAWTRKNIGMHGGDDTKIFVGGHSAGGYLTLMLGMDERYLLKAGMQVSEVAGFIPVSGQTVTHYTVREERGIGKNCVTADEASA